MPQCDQCDQCGKRRLITHTWDFPAYGKFTVCDSCFNPPVKKYTEWKPTKSYTEWKPT